MARKLTPETMIKNEVKDFLVFSGWFVFPVLQSLGSYRGIPDLIAVKDGITLFIEVKTEKGRQSEYQLKFEDNIVSHGGHYFIARGWKDVSNYIGGLEVL